MDFKGRFLMITYRHSSFKIVIFIQRKLVCNYHYTVQWLKYTLWQTTLKLILSRFNCKPDSIVFFIYLRALWIDSIPIQLLTRFHSLFHIFKSFVEVDKAHEPKLSLIYSVDFYVFLWMLFKVLTWIHRPHLF